MTHPSTITTLLFDIGDVLVALDWDQAYHALREKMAQARTAPPSLEECAEIWAPKARFSLWDDFGAGRIDGDTFVTQLATAMGYTHDPYDLKHSFNAIFTPIAPRIALLNALADTGRYKIALVSDTNPFHAAWIEENIPAIFTHLPPEQRIYSHQVGLQKKRGKEIYQHTLKIMGALPHQAVMIDDRSQNKFGADEIGLHYMCIARDDDLAVELAAQYHVTPE